METGLRKTGISVVGNIPWGTHFYHYYRSKQNLLDILIPYFKSGLENNELCVWAVFDPLSAEEVKCELRRAIPGIDRQLLAGDIEIVVNSQWFLKGGAFDLKQRIKSWKEKLPQALARGYAGMRVNGNEVWLTRKDWMDFLEYELELNEMIANQQIIVMCTYPLFVRTASKALDEARTNQYAVAKQCGNLAVFESPNFRRDMQEFTKAREQANPLTQRLLAFRHRQVPRPKVLDVNQIVTEMEERLQRLIGEDIQLQTRLDPALGSIRADPSQLEQVVMNLAINAREAMPEGGQLTIETLNVNLDLEYASKRVVVNPGTHVMLAISDTGCGMDEKTQAGIFKPFLTANGAGKGTGLGLPTVHGIVKQSGGSIRVHNRAGRGTTIKIYFPKLDNRAQILKSSPASVETMRGTETLLLAIDNVSVRRLARETLEKRGYRVLEAANVGAAFSICENYGGTIHLLLTDAVMPEMSGRELAGLLTPLRPKMKALYMSGLTDHTIIHHIDMCSETSFVQRPFTPNSLARKVREVLDRSDI